MKRVVIAVDSFKGSLSSFEVAEALKEGFARIAPYYAIETIPIADGGEGLVDAIVARCGGRYIKCKVSDPLLRPIEASYGIMEDGVTAVIEMAAASGLPLLKPAERNPMLTSSIGTGELIADAIRRGCRKFIVGIGGSATNDAGTGMLRALGYRFLDHNGEALQGGGEILEKVCRIDDSEADWLLQECEFSIACDVKNPLYGAEGAAYIYAPQKGADADMMARLDGGLRQFAHAVEEYNGAKIGEMEGAGAAGGMGGGFLILPHSRLQSGIEILLDAMHFGEIIEGCDLVITGEGKIDSQTLMGKAPSGVLSVAKAKQIPTIAICGKVEWCDELRDSGFEAIEVITPDHCPLEEAMRSEVAKKNIRLAAERIYEGYLSHR